ncbi:UNVERIFIED_CONTAM: hypothetical protein RMT77_017509 [Armadillidium vulgare]
MVRVTNSRENGVFISIYIHISPLVEKMNSRLEESILQYGQRMENEMKSMKNEIAKEVAKIIMKGTKLKRRSKRCLMKKKVKTGFLSPARKEMPSDISSSSSNDENSFVSNNSEESPLSLADPIAKALLKKKDFRSAIQVAVKKEDKEENSALGDPFIFDGNHTRLPLTEISNVNDSTIRKPLGDKNRTQLDRRPVTSTVVDNDKIVRRSTRLSLRKEHNEMSFSHAVQISENSDCVSDESTIIFTSNYLTSGSPVLRTNNVISNEDNRPLNSAKGFSSLANKTCSDTRRRSTRTSALNALKAIKTSCEILGKNSPLATTSRRKSARQSVYKYINPHYKDQFIFQILKV